MVTTRARTQPSYARIRETLRGEIAASSSDGVFRLPTERQLQERFNVSRHTVRRALQDLVAEGLIRRTSGSGTYATGLHRGAPYVRAIGSVEDVIAFAEDTRYESLEPLRLVYAPEAADKLECGSARVGVLRGRRMRDSEPIGVWTVYLPPDIVAALQKHREDIETGDEPLLVKLERSIDRPLVKAEQMITAEVADELLAVLLSLSPGDPILRIERVHVDASGRPIAYAISQNSVSTYQYRIDLYRSYPAATW